MLFSTSRESGNAESDGVERAAGAPAARFGDMRSVMRRLITALFLTVLLTAAGVSRALSASQPAYVLQAEQNYRHARAELNAAQKALAQLKQEEARLGRQAMRLRGQWLEPAKLWRATQAAQKRLVFAQQNSQQSLTELNIARDAARRQRVGPVSTPERSPQWWW
ncbi:hypothetical protein [Methylocystis bryophila]|uniref:hypothetical protein n=1 Tax=Methylocystis bryophila TaxID=655015 RepID=UPI00131A3F39|nr:hypothetical protein [Methylocystis bryophila]